MTETESVIRLQARLAYVEGRSQMARLTFIAPVGPEIDKLIQAIGESCLLGILFTDTTDDATE